MIRALRWLALACALALSVGASALTGGPGLALLAPQAPTLDLQFTSAVLDSRITASGGANASRTNSAGTLVTATAPRFDYSPTTLAPLGVLIEEARTNLLLNSLVNGTNLSTQSVTVTAQAYTLSFYGTGTITLSGTSSGAKVGAGAYPSRGVFTFTPTAGSLTLTVTGTVQYAQLEAGSFATSFIPTAGATVTRTADSVTMTGANFSAWFNPAQGTFVVEGDQEATTANAGSASFFTVDDGTVNNRFQQQRAGGAATVSALSVSGGVTTNLTGVNSLTVGAPFKAAFSYNTGNVRQVINAAAVETAAPAALPVSPNRLVIGTNLIGGTYNYGHIKRLRYWPRQSQDARLPALTTP